MVPNRKFAQKRFMLTAVKHKAKHLLCLLDFSSEKSFLYHQKIAKLSFGRVSFEVIEGFTERGG